MTDTRQSYRDFVHSGGAAGALLIVMTGAALLAANSPFADAYARAFAGHVGGLSLLHWVNDGLMTIFFFTIGLEIKREVLVGELSSRRRALLPICAALGGMLAPALLFTLVNHADPKGWAIPMATDIAFALSLLTIAGQRVPAGMRVLLVTLATVDDLGAILIIALFYTGTIHVAGLGLAGIGLLAVYVMSRLKVSAYRCYVPFAVLTWYGVMSSGVHATCAGVALGLVTPMQIERAGRSIRPLDDLIRRLHPWVNLVIMPLFAFANAGVTLGRIDAAGLGQDRVCLGILLGLIVGKPLGITLASGLAVKLGVGDLPRRVRWAHVLGVACLAGIGFTMALFMTNLSLAPAAAERAKVAIILASTVSAGIGYVLVRRSLSPTLDP